jgi:uncharacterized damage-inducible protein DinB
MAGMTWTFPEPAEVDGPLTGPERPMLEAYLRYQRRTLLSICSGLTADELVLAPLTSNLSLLGLIRHLTKVERTWFRIRAAAEPIGPLFDPALGTDYDFAEVHSDQAQPTAAAYELECHYADEAAAPLGLDHPVPARDTVMSLRMVYLHVIAEYARHNGHADQLREAIDGVTGR